MSARACSWLVLTVGIELQTSEVAQLLTVVVVVVRDIQVFTDGIIGIIGTEATKK